MSCSIEVLNFIDQCYLEQQKPKSIMSNLPHDLILKIIREADGGKYAHETKYKNCMDELNNIREFFHKNLLDCGSENYGENEEIIKVTTMSDRDYSFLVILSEEECMLEYYGYGYENSCFHYTWLPYEHWAKPNNLELHGASEDFKQEWL